MDENKNSLIEFDPSDVEANKTAAGLAYILFFLPLIMAPNSQYAKFNANQALILQIGVVGLMILNTIFNAILPIIGGILPTLALFAVIILELIGLINGFTGKTKPLPLLDKLNITIIK